MLRPQSVLAAAALLAAAFQVASADSITIIDYPGNTITYSYAYDPVGERVIGTTFSPQGLTTAYVYDAVGSTYSAPITYPGAVATGYDGTGNRVVGAYDDGNGIHGYLAPIPEPSSLLLAGLAAGPSAWIVRRVRRRARFFSGFGPSAA
jgi:PEP-CTERM motif